MDKRLYVKPKTEGYSLQPFMEGDVNYGGNTVSGSLLNTGKFLGFFDAQEDTPPDIADNENFEDFDDETAPGDTLYHQVDVWSGW